MLTQPVILVNRQIITKTCTDLYSVYSIYLLNIRQIRVWTKWRWIFFGTRAGHLTNVCDGLRYCLKCYSNKTANIKLKLFKTQCKGDIHSSKTANIIFQDSWQNVGERPYKRSSTQTRWHELFQPSSMDAFELGYDFVHVRAFTYILSWVLAKYLQF